ncbi:MAG: alpha/beta hydrolase [Prevotellaceae bacterium]|jgi:fermentation-respiration switch protein FrsA (DUF1100 family)|nr:alpha/beta hydrolase [Prevotellaceae bacterium]
MRKLNLSLFFFAISMLSVFGQDITGTWYGTLKDVQLHLVFHIEQTEDSLSARMDSPDQHAFGIPVNTVNVEDNQLKMAIPLAGILYEGQVISDSAIEGTFSQNGMKFPLNLSREAVVEEKKRPQEPHKPYPYHSEDVYFKNEAAGITLAGTFTYPKIGGKFPAVVLISGSGAQNRDEEAMGHKPFLVLSDYLTRNNIAVLRFDDRGTALSTGDFAAATTMDFAADAAAAVNYLRTRVEIDKTKIGLIGHSEGGVIAPIIASDDRDIAFIVLMAGTGLKGGDVLLSQQELIGRASGLDENTIERTIKMHREIFEIIYKNDDAEQTKELLRTFLKQNMTDEDFSTSSEITDRDLIVEKNLRQLTMPWMLQFIKFDPKTVLEKVQCPVLAINGEKDLQVSPKENLSAIEAALKKGGNPSVTIAELPNLNHLFQTAETGTLSEYVTIEETISPEVLALIADWINRSFGPKKYY